MDGEEKSAAVGSKHECKQCRFFFFLQMFYEEENAIKRFVMPQSTNTIKCEYSLW